LRENTLSTPTTFTIIAFAHRAKTVLCGIRLADYNVVESGAGL